jgi:hypothetical protein
MSNTASPEHRIAHALELVAADTGQAVFRRAAAVLRGSVPRSGRKAIDDSAALAQIQVFVDSGVAIETAARYVAVAAGGHSIDAVTRRLARKFRRTK